MCEKSLPTKSSLNKHSRIHTGDDFAVCYLCNVQYKRTSLHKHLKTVHGKREPKTCPQCGGTYIDQESLKLHINRVHKAQKVTCQVCEKEYKNQGTLSEHMEIHSRRNREFTCTTCQKSFFKSKALNVHLRIHLGTNKKLCTVCNGMFASVREHMKIHETQT